MHGCEKMLKFALVKMTFFDAFHDPVIFYKVNIVNGVAKVTKMGPN